MLKTGRRNECKKGRKVAVMEFVSSVSVQHPKPLNKNGDTK